MVSFSKHTGKFMVKVLFIMLCSFYEVCYVIPNKNTVLVNIIAARHALDIILYTNIFGK